MIVSSVSEAAWLTAFHTLPSWNPAPQPILIVAPHPDDETLGAGGLIAAERSRGASIVVAAVTNGENAYRNAAGLGELRCIEQTRALQRLGVTSDSIKRFNLPDSDIASHEQELIAYLTPLVSKDTHIIAPWTGDLHPDHEACGRAAQEVASRAGATLTWYFFWTWHWGTPASLAALSLKKFPLTPDWLLAKTDALLCHQSQLVREQGDPVLRESLLAPARRPFEVFATT